MDETLEYWQEKLAEFQEALESEQEMDIPNDTMLKLLKLEIDFCTKQIEILS